MNVLQQLFFLFFKHAQTRPCMNRWIYCDVNANCCTIICRNIAGDATGGSQGESNVDVCL